MADESVGGMGGRGEDPRVERTTRTIEYEETELYKAGLRAIEWGNLLIQSGTTLGHIAEFADRHGREVRPSLVLKSRPKEEEPGALGTTHVDGGWEPTSEREKED